MNKQAQWPRLGPRRYGAVACLTAVTVLAACGSDSDAGFTVGATNTAGSGTAYAFVAPVVNSTRVYAEVVVDSSNNTINIGYMPTVLAVAADGTITEMQQSTTGGGVTVNGTNYSLITETQTYNDFGRETGYTDTQSDGDPGACAYTPYAGGPTPPLTVGQTWTVDYTGVCNGNTAIDYSQQGTVVDVECGDRARRHVHRTQAAEHQSLDRSQWRDPPANLDQLDGRRDLPFG